MLREPLFLHHCCWPAHCGFNMRIGIALGSNLGDSREEMRLAFAFLRKLDSGALVSSLYRSSPVNCPPGSPEFINAVAEISFSDGLMYLLEKLQSYEKERGRPEDRALNSPRPVDLDILYAEDLEMRTVRLTLPHPRMMERLFVLEPLCEIRPELILPAQSRPVTVLLEELKQRSHDQVCRKLE